MRRLYIALGILLLLAAGNAAAVKDVNVFKHELKQNVLDDLPRENSEMRSAHGVPVWGGNTQNDFTLAWYSNESDGNHLTRPFHIFMACNRNLLPQTMDSVKLHVVEAKQAHLFTGYQLDVERLTPKMVTVNDLVTASVCTTTAVVEANGTNGTRQTCTEPVYEPRSYASFEKTWQPLDASALLLPGECAKIKVQGNRKAALGEVAVDFLLEKDGVTTFGAAWANSSCSYRQPIRIRTSGVSATVANFTGNYSVNTAALIAAGKMQSNCGAYFIANDNTTARNYYPESCNSASVNTEYWFNTPLTTTNDTDVWMYYGPNCGGTPSASNTFSDYDVTMFLNETYNASRLNIISGAASTSAASGVTNGTFGNGSNYNATTATYDRWASSAAFLPAPNAFWSAYFKAGNAAGSGRVLTKTQQGSARHRYTILIDSNTVFCGIARDAGQSCAAVTAAIITDNSVFHHAACSFTSANRVEAWVDGVYRTGVSCAHAFNDATPEAFCLGQFGDACNAESYNGKIDDVRITDTLPTNQTIESMWYKNIYYTVGTEEALGNVSFVAPTPLYNNSFINASYQLVNASDTSFPGDFTLYVWNTTVSGVGFNMSVNSTAGGATFNLTSNAGVHTLLVSHGGVNSSMLGMVFPYLIVRGYNESDASQLNVSLSFNNGTNVHAPSGALATRYMHNETLQGTSTVTASASGFNDRSYSFTRNNSVQFLDVYLASTASSDLYTFLIRTAGGLTVTDASMYIERNIAGTYVNVTSGACDANGICVFYLVTGVTYRINALSPTYGYGQTTLTVSTSPITIILGDIAQSFAYVQTFKGVDWFFEPAFGVYNGSFYNFNFSLTALTPYKINFTSYSFCMIYQNGTYIRCTNATQYNGSKLNVSFYTPNDNFVRGIYNFTLNDTANSTYSNEKLWVIYRVNGPLNQSDFYSNVSLYSGLQLVKASLGDNGWLPLTFLAIIVSVAVAMSLGLGGLGAGVVGMGIFGLIVVGIGIVPWQLFGLGVLVMAGITFYFRG